MESRYLSVAAAFALVLAGCAAGDAGRQGSVGGGEMKQVIINPPERMPIYERWQYSQAIRVGNTVWLAGQVGWDENNQIVEGFEAQTRLAFQNLQQVLEESGASLEDVVELVTYHVNVEDLMRFAEIKSEFFPKHYPPWTVVGVKSLALPDLLIEIKATAVIGSGTESPGPGSE